MYKNVHSSFDLVLLFVRTEVECGKGLFMASHLKTADHSGTRKFVSKRLQQTKVLKNVSSTVKILVSYCSLYQLMLQSWYKKTWPIIGEHFVVIVVT